MTTPEFSTPTYDQVKHWLRPLSYADRMVGHHMTPSAGNKAHDMYSFAEALKFTFANDLDAPYLNQSFKGGINWIDVDRFIEWVGGTVGDTQLADAMRAPGTAEESLFGKIRAIEPIVMVRVEQYRAVRDEAEGVADATPEVAEEPVTAEN